MAKSIALAKQTAEEAAQGSRALRPDPQFRAASSIRRLRAICTKIRES
jgi:hypothetical protein